MPRRPAVFLDRDGTIIHDRPGFYLRRPEQVRIYPPVFEALRLLKRAGFRLVVISNQSGIGRGLLDLATLARIHRRLRAALKRRGADVDAVYFCPHLPGDGCRCRKPSPTLARRAVRELGLSLAGSAVVGDKKVDVDLARALGVPAVHVATGHGRRERERWGRRLAPAHRTRDVLGAARWILRRHQWTG